MQDAVTLWTPPRVSHDPRFVDVWNAIVSATAATLPLRGNAKADVSLLDANDDPAAHAWLLSFEGGQTIIAIPRVFPFSTLLGVDLEAEDLPLLPPVLREALEEGLVSILSTVLPDHGRGPMVLRGSGPVAAINVHRPEDLRWFRGDVAGLAPTSITFDIGLTLEALAETFGFGLARRAVWANVKGQITRDLDVTLGRLTTTMHEMSTLRVGSIVVLDGTKEEAQTCQLRLGTRCYKFRSKEQQWLCIAMVDIGLVGTRGESEMTNNAVDAASDRIASETSANSPLDLLDIAIDFDIGRVTVSIGEIESWREGSLVALRVPLAKEGVEVTIRANGRAIGRGDLVQIDDRLAVRLTEMTFRS